MKEYNKKLNFCIAEKDWEEFKYICEIENRAQSKVMRCLILEYIKEYKKNKKGE